MRDIQHNDGAFAVSSDVADALEKLAVALSTARMSAHITLKPPGQEETVEFTLGMDRASGKQHRLRARPSTGEGSHLGWEDA